jgi:hypothetical protein
MTIMITPFMGYLVQPLDILRSEIDEARLLLPERFRQVPVEDVFGMLVNTLVDSKLVAAEARKVNLHKDAKVVKQMARIEEQILGRAFLVAYIEQRVCLHKGTKPTTEFRH